MSGISAVESRIGVIQTRMASFTATRSNEAWNSAASLSGLTAAGATSGTTSALASSTSNGAKVVADATQYLGVPYKWGGTDPQSGLDCSGLTQRVYSDLGISIPRTASQQSTAGTAVASLDEALPGDLVFFDNSSRPGIDHVGIYIGNGQMIAAPQEGDVVKVQSVGKPSVIRRILPANGSATTPATTSVAKSTGTGSLAGVPYADLFASAGAANGISPALLAAVAKTESGYNPSAVSPAGAQGLMQFMPATAAGLGIDPTDPTQAVNVAARYLRQLTDQFGSTDLALAAYNAGPGAVSSYGGIPPYPETQAYVTKVKNTAAGLS